MMLEEMRTGVLKSCSYSKCHYNVSRSCEMNVVPGSLSCRQISGANPFAF